MRVALYLNIPSPHQMPLTAALGRLLGRERVCYVSAAPMDEERRRMGWCAGDAGGVPVVGLEAPGAREWLSAADILLTGVRDVGLFERRAANGLRTFYTSERWFKPALGIGRLLCPAYLRMARRLVRLIRAGDVVYLPIGVWAARDMARLARLFAGDLRAPLRAPAPASASAPMEEALGFPWMRMWGYFVAPSAEAKPRQAAADTQGRALRVLWVGRLLAWKRVDTLFKAAAACLEKFPLTLTVVGDGPERTRLERLGRRLFARNPGALAFRHSVPIGEVRQLMRSHDVYVLPSNGYEGWGAVVSEALEEGMCVLGTFEAGASATILPRERLFRAGDWRMLARLLEGERAAALPPCSVGDWTAAKAAERFLHFVGERV